MVFLSVEGTLLQDTLATLNEQQRRAVITTEGPLLVMAGAGSGKTRVLTYRVGHIVASQLAKPWSVLCITFTNKAATEMRHRIHALLSGQTTGVWVHTFHGLCARILRTDIQHLGYDPYFYPLWIQRDQVQSFTFPVDEGEFGCAEVSPSVISFYHKYSKE